MNVKYERWTLHTHSTTTQLSCLVPDSTVSPAYYSMCNFIFQNLSYCRPVSVEFCLVGDIQGEACHDLVPVVSQLIGFCQACLKGPLPTIAEVEDESDAEDNILFLPEEEEQETFLDAEGFPRSRGTICWRVPESSDCQDSSDGNESSASLRER